MQHSRTCEILTSNPPTMCLPSFLCIGAQKAATSWLFVTLQEHPDIWMPAIKELHYFDYLYVPQCRGWAHKHISKTAKSAILRQLADAKTGTGAPLTGPRHRAR